MLKKIAVFASGGGTDFQSIIDANEKEGFCEIKYLVASKPEIGAIDRAKKAGIATIAYDKAKGGGIAAFYKALTERFQSEGIDYIVLAGWLLIIPADFISSFEDRIINIHPALIPSFCGKGFYGLKVHEAAISYGVKLSGAESGDLRWFNKSYTRQLLKSKNVREMLDAVDVGDEFIRRFAYA